MSYKTYKNWYYQLHGRYIHLWQLANNASIDTLGSYKIRLPGERSSIQLIYPDEDITSGLRIEYTSFNESEIFISEALENTLSKVSGITIAFVAPAIQSNTITDSASGFNFEDGDRIRVQGSTSNDGDYTLNGTANDGTLTTDTATFTTEAAGQRITITQIPKTGATADETAHINLNRMLCLAVVDYVKAQQKDAQGDIQAKEYYMKQFWKKIGDDQSNKRKISMSFPIPIYSVK